MSYLKKEFTFPSVSGLADIHCASYLPEGTQVKAVLQIAHGMAEHLERYEGFARVLCENGIAVYINDHLGHGGSVKNDDELGYFGKKDGWKHFVEDCHELTKIAKSENPGKPYIFFGHSMGSFVARAYSFKYSAEIDGAVYCGEFILFRFKIFTGNGALDKHIFRKDGKFHSFENPGVIQFDKFFRGGRAA